MAHADKLYSQLVFKASHNSYSKPPFLEHLDWTPAIPHRGGCRGLELDVIQKKDGWEWAVRHEEPWTDYPPSQLKAFLEKLAQWSAGRGGNHDVIMVHINLKSSRLSNSQFPAAFDSYVRRAMGDAELFTPGELLGDADNLLSAALQHGWPTLGELYGRFIFCITGSQEARTNRYTATELAQRLCFCDAEVPDPTKPKLPDWTRPNRVIYNFAAYYDGDEWVEAIAGVPDRDAYLIRAYGVDVEHAWNDAIEAGVNILATDQILKTRWARVGPPLFVPRSMPLPRLVPAVRGIQEAAARGRVTDAQPFTAEELPFEDLQLELHRLRDENRVLREEREILTRAVAVMARQVSE